MITVVKEEEGDPLKSSSLLLLPLEFLSPSEFYLNLEYPPTSLVLTQACEETSLYMLRNSNRAGTAGKIIVILGRGNRSSPSSTTSYPPIILPQPHMRLERDRKSL